MGRGRDFRGGGKGRRPFEEDPDAPTGGSDSFQPPQFSRSPSPMQGAGSVGGGPAVDAIVKWFNPEKGFGFAEIADGSGDAFLHVKAVQALGRETIPPGAKLSVQVGQGQKGRQITKVLSIISEGDGAPPPARHPSPAASPSASHAPTCRPPPRWLGPSNGSARPRAWDLSRSTAAGKTFSSTSRSSSGQGWRVWRKASASRCGSSTLRKGGRPYR